MTLMPVEASPSLRLISKAAEIDPEGTRELVRLALYETLCDQVEFARPSLEGDMAVWLAKRDAQLRRATVRKFIDARLAGEDVSEVVEFSKETAAQKDRDLERGWLRNLLGQFTRHGTGATTAAQAFSGQKAQDTDSPFDRPKYSHLRATGAALTSLDDPNAKLIGGAATALGGLGPEAEKVLGQGLRRTAYRYRGTEKRPSKELKDDIKSGMKIIDQDPVVRATAQRAINADKDESIVARQTSGKPFDKDRSSLRAVEGVSPSVQVATYYADRTNLSQDQKEMRVAGDLAARYYLDKLPSEEQTRISIAAGAVPPSQGVIIDADGDVVSEAMGFNGDHYVPFDLKNLRSLQGGQYVRTRATGGPTTEDIYTGLLSGARQLQVVSQSGVFTVEFDPSLRGGRRYSDKARQMVGRYQRLLDAVDQGPKAGLYQHDLDPAEIRQIRRDAADQFRDPDNAKTYGDRKINEARAAQSFNMLTDEEIDEKAKALLAKEPQANRGRLQELRNEVRDQARKDSVKAFTLDGDGYEAALKALKEEFPYFVRTVKREKLPDFVDARGLKDKTRFSSAKDRGYVSPKNAASGLANSVTRSHQGTQVRRGFYDAPEKTTAGAVTGPPAASEGAQEGQSAPEAAQASAGQLTNALANPTLHRLTEQFGHNVAQALPYLDVDETKYLTPEKDGDFKRLLANEVILAVDERATEHKEGFASYLATQGPQERAAYKKALNDIDDMLDGTNISNTIKRGVIESAEDLHATLELITPFAQGSPLSYDPSQNNGTPLHFGSVARIGMDLDAYQRIQEHEISQNTTTGNYLEMFSGADPDESDPLKVIPALITKIEKLPEGSKERESAVKDLEGAKKAYSFMRARDLAASFHELVGTEEPERPGKAPAPQAGATVPLTIPYTQQVTKPVIKRLTWHSPGGPVATAFQEFLASR